VAFYFVSLLNLECRWRSPLSSRADLRLVLTEGFDTLDLKEAKALLEELNSSPDVGN
jgi:hypothetical protein